VVTEQRTVGLPAAICFAVACALVLFYVLIAQPGIRDSGAVTSRAKDQRPAAAVQATGPVEGRNELRLQDLAALGEALEKYARANNGAFVSTNGNLQTLCTYQGLDAGCALSEHLNPLPSDPAGRNFGYYYLSDGKSYVLGARWEGDQAPPDGFQCPQDFRPEPQLGVICIAGRR
jgi:hypothetical protein